MSSSTSIQRKPYTPLNWFSFAADGELYDAEDSLGYAGEHRDEFYNTDGERRRNFDFKMLRIVEGERLTFKENRRISCVVDQQVPPLVLYRRQRWRLSGLTSDLKGGGSYSGTLYWEYDGELLDDRRRRLTGD